MKTKRSIQDAIIAGGVKWSSIYDTEEELIADLLKSEQYEQRFTKGYVYLESFKKQVNAGKTLSTKQMTMLKRLASEVYKNVHWHSGFYSTYGTMINE